MKPTFLDSISRRPLALAALTLLLTACGADNARPTAAQAAAIATEAAQSPPAITVQPLDAAVSAGARATFRVSATGEALTYQWLRNGEPVPRAVEPSFTAPAASITESGTRYSVTVANRHGQVTSEPATLTVTEAMFSN